MISMLLTYIIIGSFLAVSLWKTGDPFTFALLTLSAAMFMTAVTVIMEYSSVVVNPDDHDIIGYVIEGETYLLDEDSNKIPIGPGDRLVIPKGAWHAEGEVSERVVYIVTLRDAIPLLEGILPKEPRGPFPAFDN